MKTFQVRASTLRVGDVIVGVNGGQCRVLEAATPFLRSGVLIPTEFGGLALPKDRYVTIVLNL